MESAQSFLPEVVLLDIGLPKLNGYEVAQRIRESPWGASMFLIAVTGWGQDEDRQRSSEVGLNVHMVKPVEPSALEKLLAGIAARRTVQEHTKSDRPIEPKYVKCCPVIGRSLPMRTHRRFALSSFDDSS